MNWRIRLPGAVYRKAVDRAGSDASLADIARQWVSDYADEKPSAQQLGGRASQAALTPEQRSVRMKALVERRWALTRQERAK